MSVIANLIHTAEINQLAYFKSVSAQDLEEAGGGGGLKPVLSVHKPRPMFCCGS